MLVSSSRRRLVWIVDASAPDAERARRALRGSYAVEVHRDGASALDRLAAGERSPDVLVIDWTMPGVSALDVCRFVRASEDRQLRHVGILILTIRARTEQVVEGLDAGAHDFIMKPCAPAELRARVSALVRRKELFEGVERAEGALRELFRSGPGALLGLHGQELGAASSEARPPRRDDRVDLVALARETIDDFRPLAEASQLTLSTGADADAIEVRGDRRRLKQVSSNLIANAIKFTPKGGSVSLSLRAEDDDAVLTVADTGCGIAADVIPKLFERYLRAVDGGDEVAGTGLGLVIVRETVIAHGGSVGVESTEGTGSEFWIRLPLAQPERAQPSGSSTPDAARVSAASHGRAGSA